MQLISKRLVRHGCAGAAAIAAVLLMTTAGGDARAAGSVSFSEITQGSRGHDMPAESERASARVLRSAAQASRQLRAWGIDPAATRNVNFSRDNVIVFLAAYQPTGGYRARVSKVAALGGRAVVSAAVRYEGGDVVASSIERPWVIVRVRRSALAGVSSAARIRALS